MPEVLDPTGGDYTGNTPHVSDDQMLANASAARQRGDRNWFRMLPPKWLVDPDTGQPRTRTFWEEYGPALIMAGAVVTGGLLAPVGAAAGAAQAGSGIGSMGAGSAATAAGAGSVLPVAAGAAAGGAVGAAAGGGSDVLPSTQIGNGMITGAPSSVPSGAVSTASGGGSNLPDWLKVAQDLNNIGTAQATGQAAGRNADNIANIGYANAQSNLYGNELAGYSDALAAPGKIASNAVRGDILSNARDVSLSASPNIPVPTISGGLRPSMFSDQTRQLGKDMTTSAANTPIPTATMPTPPTLAPFESAGTGTDILNAANTVTGLLPAGYDIWKMFNA